MLMNRIFQSNDREVCFQNVNEFSKDIYWVTIVVQVNFYEDIVKERFWNDRVLDDPPFHDQL